MLKVHIELYQNGRRQYAVVMQHVPQKKCKHDNNDQYGNMSIQENMGEL